MVPDSTWHQCKALLFDDHSQRICDGVKGMCVHYDAYICRWESEQTRLEVWVLKVWVWCAKSVLQRKSASRSEWQLPAFARHVSILQRARVRTAAVACSVAWLRVSSVAGRRFRSPSSSNSDARLPPLVGAVRRASLPSVLCP